MRSRRLPANRGVNVTRGGVGDGGEFCWWALDRRTGDTCRHVQAEARRECKGAWPVVMIEQKRETDRERQRETERDRERRVGVGVGGGGESQPPCSPCPQGPRLAPRVCVRVRPCRLEALHGSGRGVKNDKLGVERADGPGGPDAADHRAGVLPRPDVGDLGSPRAVRDEARHVEVFEGDGRARVPASGSRSTAPHSTAARERQAPSPSTPASRRGCLHGAGCARPDSPCRTGGGGGGGEGGGGGGGGGGDEEVEVLDWPAVRAPLLTRRAWPFAVCCGAQVRLSCLVCGRTPCTPSAR